MFFKEKQNTSSIQDFPAMV